MNGILHQLFVEDDRAVAPVLGVALLFAIAAIGLSVWQTTVIPQQNADVEFDHYAEIQEDMDDLRAAHLDTVSSGEPQSTTLQLGVAYQSRVIGVNPPNPQGSLESRELGNVTIENAEVAVSGETVNTRGLCGVSEPHTDELRYDPGYNRLSDRETPPIVYENSVVYRETDDGKLFESGQVLIQGSTVNLLPLQSEAGRSRRSTTMTLESQGYQVEKTLVDDATPTVVVPSNLDEETWETELLAAPISKGTVTNVDKTGSNVRISLGNLQTVPDTDSQWTVRCAITTDGDETAILEGVAEPPRILNGGVGHGGTTEHTIESNTDELVIPNGKWYDVDSVSEIRLGPTETTDVPNQGGFNGGQGMGVSYKIDDGESNRTVYMTVEATGEPGNWQAKTVKLTDDPNNCCQSKSLTSEAARKILETGRPDVLDVGNYKTNSFQTQDGSFGEYIEMIRSMENATIQITGLHGRVDMQVIAGTMELEIAAVDRTQTVVKGETSSIDVEVTAKGHTDQPENIDLKVRDSQGQQIDATSPRVDRETIDLDGGSETFTLGWAPDWNNGLSNTGTYEILVEGESDQVFGQLRVISDGSAYVEVELLNHSAPVEYGDNLTATVRAENIGEKPKTDSINLPIAGSCCPNSAKAPVDLDPGESENVTLRYDTGNLGTSKIGEVQLTAKSNNFNSKDTTRVNVTDPAVILDPTVESLPAKETGLNQTIAFTLGEKTGGATIRIDLRDTGDAVEYASSSDSHWAIQQGHGQISLNTNNNRVTSVKYQTKANQDLAGDRIVLEAGDVTTTNADPNVQYTVQYELSSTNNLPQGETNATTFETTPPSG